MIYTTNWIERLQKDFRRVTRMRGAMPDELSVIVLMGKTAMDKDSYRRVIPRMREEGFSSRILGTFPPPYLGLFVYRWFCKRHFTLFISFSTLLHMPGSTYLA